MRESGRAGNGNRTGFCRLALLLILSAGFTTGLSSSNDGPGSNSVVVENSKLIEKRSLKGKVARFAQSVFELLQDTVFNFGGASFQIKVDDAVCYDYVGCFSSGDRFTVPTSFPDHPDAVNTSLMLFSRTNMQDPVFLDYKPATRRTNITHLRLNRALKIIVHGWRDNKDNIWIQRMKDALLQEEDCYVIIVDWSKGAATLNYVFAAGNTALVGRELSLLAQRLAKTDGINSSGVHCIGHSLGAHACGFFGRHFKDRIGLLIGRISALDAADPLFGDTDVFVSSQDAQFVDVIHTSEGHWYIRNGVGMMKAVGHVDFYPNFGKRQPGCAALDIACDHRLSADYFLESITNKKCRFRSKSCDEASLKNQSKNCVGRGTSGEMGYFSIGSAGRGVQYLSTHRKSPYCKNKL